MQRYGKTADAPKTHQRCRSFCGPACEKRRTSLRPVVQLPYRHLVPACRRSRLRAAASRRPAARREKGRVCPPRPDRHTKSPRHGPRARGVRAAGSGGAQAGAAGAFSPRKGAVPARVCGCGRACPSRCGAARRCGRCVSAARRGPAFRGRALAARCRQGGRSRAA